MTTTKTFTIATVLAIAMLVFSCDREKNDDKDILTRIVQNNAIAESLFNDVGNQVQDGMSVAQDEVSNPDKVGNSIQSNCATITITPFDLTTFPKEIQIDFGAGCVGNDGRTRKGILNIHTTGWYRDSSTVITITPDQYYVNDFLVQGMKTMTNNGRNAGQNLHYTVEIDGSITNNQGTITFVSERENEWIAGEPTVLNPWDDEYLITGWQNGVTMQSDQYQITITQALHVKVNCKYVVAGTLKLTSSGLQDELTVDYGNGTCDAIAVVTYMGQQYTIVMQ
jgi:hypothetical protein